MLSQDNSLMVWPGLSRCRGWANRSALRRSQSRKHAARPAYLVPSTDTGPSFNWGKTAFKAPLVPRDLGTSDRIEMSGNLLEAPKSRISGAPEEEDHLEDLGILTERFAKRLGQVSVPRNLGRAC